MSRKQEQEQEQEAGVDDVEHLIGSFIGTEPLSTPPAACSWLLLLSSASCPCFLTDSPSVRIP